MNAVIDLTQMGTGLDGQAEECILPEAGLQINQRGFNIELN